MIHYMVVNPGLANYLANLHLLTLSNNQKDRDGMEWNYSPVLDSQCPGQCPQGRKPTA